MEFSNDSTVNALFVSPEMEGETNFLRGDWEEYKYWEVKESEEENA
jgi:hypothetical protein